MLATLLLFGLLIGQRHSAKSTVRVLRSFAVDDARCELQAIDRDLPIPDEKITIACNDLPLLTDDLGQASILAVEIDGRSPSYSADERDRDSVRAIVTYESGLTTTLVAYEISESRGKPVAKLVYTHSSKIAPEPFEGGYVILEHVRRRFFGNAILPGGTNVYRWQDGHYKYIESFTWSEGASFADRYCILYKPETCPGQHTKIRILDEYEH